MICQVVGCGNPEIEYEDPTHDPIEYRGTGWKFRLEIHICGKHLGAIVAKSDKLIRRDDALFRIEE